MCGGVDGENNVVDGEEKRKRIVQVLEEEEHELKVISQLNGRMELFESFFFYLDNEIQNDRYVVYLGSLLLPRFPAASFLHEDDRDCFRNGHCFFKPLHMMRVKGGGKGDDEEDSDDDEDKEGGKVQKKKEKEEIKGVESENEKEKVEKNKEIEGEEVEKKSEKEEKKEGDEKTDKKLSEEKKEENKPEEGKKEDKKNEGEEKENKRNDIVVETKVNEIPEPLIENNDKISDE
jgi:hypothetical protein